MSPVTLQEKLTRFDRRLRLRRTPGSCELYDIVYKDAAGLRAVAVRGFDPGHGDRELFKSMLASSPWKQNAAYGQWMRDIEAKNTQLEDTSSLSRAAAEEAWEINKFYRRWDSRVSSWAEGNRRGEVRRMEKMERLVHAGATDEDIGEDVGC